jgi:alcohol dehydrogenase class IV
MPPTHFRHVEPALRLFYGADCLARVREELRRLGARRAVIFCGRSLANASPGAATVRQELGELCAGVFDQVQQHSPLSAVLAGRDALARLEADAVIALGGGSAIVSARAATIALGELQPLEQLCTRLVPGQPPHSPRLAGPRLPQLLIPTTPSAAIPRAGAAVTEPPSHRRLALFDPRVRPAAVFLLPELFCDAPAPRVLDAALNGFVSTIQGLESTRRQPLADARLLHALRLMVQYLPRVPGIMPDSAVDGAADGLGEARGQLMLAAVLAGQGVEITGAGLASALAHAIGTQCGVGNGLAGAIVLPHTLRFNADATDHRLEEALRILGGAADSRPAGQALSEHCAALFRRLGLPARLRDVAVDPSDLPQLAERTAEDWFTSQNPAPVQPGDIAELLSAAW